MKWLLMLGLLLSTHNNRHNVLIPVSCLTKTIILTGCDVRGETPKDCKHAIVTYRKDCFIIQN